MAFCEFQEVDADDIPVQIVGILFFISGIAYASWNLCRYSYLIKQKPAIMLFYLFAIANLTTRMI